MKRRFSSWLLTVALLPLPAVQAAELTGRFSMLGTTAKAEQGDIGYIDADNKTLTADQQSLRLMLEDIQNNGEWSIHLKTRRQHLSGYPANELNSSGLFRYRDFSHDWLDERGSNSATRVGYELDRAVYKHRFDNITLGIGRQPIDWGTGRFWQPLNVFGAFAPTDLDTDFKPGIDAAVLDWYPSAFSSVTAVYAFAPDDNTAIDDSGAFHYRRQVGERSELSLLAGHVIGDDVMGAAFESEWSGLGWRIEGVYYRLEQTDESELFWIAGIDYQFNDGTLIAAEWYDNNRGATDEAPLVAMQSDRLASYGLQPYLSRRVLGISAKKDITPLLNGNYTMLSSALKDTDNHLSASMLHQFNLIYSVSNESDLLLSLLYASGKGLNPMAEPQSEFGHTPTSMTVRLRFYY